MSTDDDIRTMLRSKATEVRVSDDAWDKISARLQDAPGRPIARRIAVASAAAAAVAGTVFVANLPGPTSQVAIPTTTEAPFFSEPFISEPAMTDPVIIATEWLRSRAPEADLVAGTFEDGGDGNGRVVFHEGGVQTEVHVRQASGPQGWGVVSAASDMITLHDVTFDGRNLQGRAAPHADGTIAITYLADRREEPGGTHEVTARQDRGLDFPTTAATAGVRVTLRVGGTTYLSEVTAERVVDPAKAAGSYVAVHPATDSVGLAEFQRQADDGFRPDLLDPQAVAGAFLAELLPRNESPTSYTVGEFQRGDNTSGEVPYTLSDGAGGKILLRTMGGDDAIWYVTGAASYDLTIVVIHREERDLNATIKSAAPGTLRWTGAESVEVTPGTNVALIRPNTPLGNYPVVIRLMDGDRTLAISARLG